MNNILNNLLAIILTVVSISTNVPNVHGNTLNVDSEPSICFQDANIEAERPVDPNQLINIMGREGSIPTANVVILSDTTIELNMKLCSGDHIEVNGQIYNEINPTGVVVLTSSSGCDSTIMINLTFELPTVTQIQYLICAGDSVTINNVVYNENNPTTTETLMSACGCDSIVTIDVSFVETGFMVNGFELIADFTDADSYQWLLNGNPIAGASNSTWTVTESGDYSLILEVNGFSCSSETTFVAYSNVYEIPEEARIKIRPNPTRDWLFIDLSSALEDKLVRYEISDLLGRIVQNGDFNNKIRVESLRPGVVLLHLIDQDQNVYTRKLTLEQ